VTINIGIKCTDGIVIASDSQVGFGRGVEVKRVNANKIYNWDGRFALSGSGILAQIQTVVDNIKAAIAQREESQRSHLNKDECEDTIERVMWALYARYNIQRSQAIGADEREFFNPICVFAARNAGEDGNDVLCLYIIHANGIVEPVLDYATAGSGAAYAEILLKNLFLDNMNVQEATKIAIYVINEVKEIDPNCGGPTKIGVLTQQGYNELSEKEIHQITQNVKPILDLIRTSLVLKALRGEIDANAIETISREREAGS
jgi:20S proteasome alpha/beta subunit